MIAFATINAYPDELSLPVFVAGIFAEAKMSDQRLQQEVIGPLQQSESIDIVMETLVNDSSGNEVAIARTTWQIKLWDRVRTRV